MSQEKLTNWQQYGREQMVSDLRNNTERVAKNKRNAVDTNDPKWKVTKLPPSGPKRSTPQEAYLYAKDVNDSKKFGANSTYKDGWSNKAHSKGSGIRGRS